MLPRKRPRSPPPVKGAETETPPDDGVLPDLTTVDLRAQYLVPNAAHGAEFRALKAKTPARLGLGRCGARYPTASLLRFRADHAAAQDSVFSLVPERFWEENHYPFVQTMCKSKDEYLTRPDLGRRFDEKNQAVLRDLLAGQRVVLAVGDGLSSAAVQANAPDCCAAIRQGLQAQGIELGPVPFIQFCRVGAGDHIGDLTDCEVICLLVGERPGLVTNESMSAYLTYRPHTGIAESCRTVVSNIHRQGVSAVEAGAHIASLIGRILAQRPPASACGRTAHDRRSRPRAGPVRPHDCKCQPRPFPRTFARSRSEFDRAAGDGLRRRHLPRAGRGDEGRERLRRLRPQPLCRGRERAHAPDGRGHRPARPGRRPPTPAAALPPRWPSCRTGRASARRKTAFSTLPTAPRARGRTCPAWPTSPRGSPLAYLIAPPVPALLGLDAALKAAGVELAEFYAPPTETNFAGALLTGTRSACLAACTAFAEAVCEAAARPLEAEGTRRNDHGI